MPFKELLKFLEPLEQSLLKGGVSPTLSFELNLLELLALLRLIPLILLFKLMLQLSDMKLEKQKFMQLKELRLSLA